MTKLKLLAAASLILGSLTSYASAQCVDCAIYPNLDHLNGGETPAAKMGLEHAGGAASAVGSGVYNAAIEPKQPAARTVRKKHVRKSGT